MSIYLLHIPLLDNDVGGKKIYTYIVHCYITPAMSKLFAFPTDGSPDTPQE